MFIGRNKDGSIYGTWTVRQWVDQEELADDAAEVVAFVNRPLPAPPTVADALLADPAGLAKLKAQLANGANATP